MNYGRHCHTIVAATTVAVAVGCAAQQPAMPTAGPTSSAVSAAPATVVQFDPQWMGLVANQPQGWEELNRRITSDFQQFNLRPADELDNPFGCNGCAPWTATLTAYAPGQFDPTVASTGQPISVNSDGDGFLIEDPARHAATLAWQYADDAWATVRGLTDKTVELDRMVEFAHALQPAQRSPIRLPLSMANVPVNLPLAELSVDRSEYGTRLEFAPCGRTDVSGTEDCMVKSDHLGVQIWPTDRYYGHIREDRATALTIDGKDGLYDERVNQFAVQVSPGTLVVFELSGPYPAKPTVELEDILTGVEWAPDPGNAETWPGVSDWVK
jgi:hypothetical protein